MIGSREGASAQSAQLHATPAPRDMASAARVTLEGFVLAPDGSPAEGAVVVSSAGGRAVTDVAGNYRLEVEVPLEAASVQVTAVGRAGGHLVASRSVALSGAVLPTHVDPLALSLGSSCSPSWLPTFGGRRETNDEILDWAVYDDGGGAALYAGGEFTTAGGVAANRIAKWDGSSWSALGSGVDDYRVQALAVYDDGTGPALYAGGHFLNAGGVPALRIAKWDGSSWSALGGGILGGNASVRSLAVFDDGSGPALYAGGTFTGAGSVAANGIAKWDGSSWSALGTGLGTSFSETVEALAVYDDGGGPALYAGGMFTSAGGVAVNRIAKWDGSSWSTLGSGMDSGVLALAVHDDGGGSALYAGGGFTSAGGVAAKGIAKWNGSTWSPLGSGFDGSGTVAALAVFDEGSGPALYAGGHFTSTGIVPLRYVAKWDGSTWSPLGSGMGSPPGSGTFVFALAEFDDDDGPELYAGGLFFEAGGEPASYGAKWDGAKWAPIGGGVSNVVKALAEHDDGGGPALFAAGEFIGADGVTANRIARWDGSSWAALGGGMDADVLAMAVHDDGGGPALYAGGEFTSAGGVAANRIARWDGSSWSALGGGMGSPPGSGTNVLALAEFDDGDGAELYAGGGFTSAGGVTANHIAKWDGSSWAALGSGMNARIWALAVHDDGGGTALYAGGEFTTAGGVAANRIARWDGSGWSTLGSGTIGAVHALATYDDGTGTALYAAGRISNAGGVDANRIAKWNGASWEALGSGTNSVVEALVTYDDGCGTALYAGGLFTTAGGVAANRIAKWDGSSWTALASGLDGPVATLAVHDDGGGPALYVGGEFARAFDSADSYLAKWGFPDSVPPVLSCPPHISVPDRFTDGQEVVYFSVTATDAVDPAPVVVCVPPSGSTFPLGTTLVTCTATDASGNQSTCEFPVSVSLKVRRR